MLRQLIAIGLHRFLGRCCCRVNQRLAVFTRCPQSLVRKTSSLIHVCHDPWRHVLDKQRKLPVYLVTEWYVVEDR